MNDNQTRPLVSVVLPVYNGETYLKESIDSIISQTYTNFELLIINDGSTDKSEEICLSYNDDRIKYIFQKNEGLAETLNNALTLCKGKYIARQDQDDISYKNRFQKQVDFLEKNESIVLLGARAKIFSDEVDYLKTHNHATQPSILKFDLMFNNPFVHSTIMFRKTSLEIVGYYNTNRSFYEDYELWSRFVQAGDVANLPDVLLDYRHHDQGLSKSTNYFKDDAIYHQNIKNIESLLGYKSKFINELAAVIHNKTELYKDSSYSELKKIIQEISLTIIKQYPQDEKIIKIRLKQYLRIISYKINVMKRIQYKNYPLIVILLKIKNKLHLTPARIIND